VEMVEVVEKLGPGPRPQMRTPNGFGRAQVLSVPCACGSVHVGRPEGLYELLKLVVVGNKKAPALEGRGVAHRLTVTRWGT